jgi:hypothetical protein
VTVIAITTGLQAKQFHFGKYCLQIRFDETSRPKADLLVYTAPHSSVLVAQIQMNLIVDSAFNFRSLWNIHPVMTVPSKARHDPGLSIDLVHNGTTVLSTWVDAMPVTQLMLAQAKRMLL